MAQGGVFAPVGAIDLALALVTCTVEPCIVLTITGSDLAPDTNVTLTLTLPDGVTVAPVVGQVRADGTVVLQSGQEGVGHLLCGTTAITVSALAEDGTTTVTDTAAPPC